jgi:hypothetical protein
MLISPAFKPTPRSRPRKDRMGSSGHRARDLVQVELHGFGIGVGHRQTGTGAARRTNGSEEIGAVVALIGWLAWPRSASGPLPHDPVLLTDAGFVLKPDLDRLALREVGDVGPQRTWKVFLNAATVCPS